MIDRPASTDGDGKVVIRAQGLGKLYRLYGRPEDRLKELIFRRRAAAQDFWAVRDLDLEVRRGETIGIIGRNGSGKSTLLQMVCGTLQPTTGFLEVHGRVAALLELGAGFNPDFTGRENVYLSATVLGLTEAEIAARLPAIEAFAEIGAFIDQPVRQYSSGMYARLAFSVCAHVDADILVVDEVLAVGDAGFQQRCMRFLHAFRERGTLLFVSHDESAVVSLCDRALWIHQGTVRATGVSKEVCGLYRAFVSREMVGENTDAFQTGGSSSPPTDVKTQPMQEVAESVLQPFDFDFDVPVDTPSAIERIILSDPTGRPVDVVEGGAEVLLTIVIAAPLDLEKPVVAFVLRNRLGQIILRDDTASTDRLPTRIAMGQRFSVTFRFCMPHLLPADYSIEPSLFERRRSEPVARLLDSFFVHVHSNPLRDGIANVTMFRKQLLAGEGPSTRTLVTVDGETKRLINDPRWRGKNQIHVQPFNADAPWFGFGGAQIIDGGFLGANGARLTQIQGGDEVVLYVRAIANRRISNPVIGFLLRNSLGQNIFCDNTSIGADDAERAAEAGEVVTGSFCFQMPFLPEGNYAIAPAIVDDTPEGRVHLHWIEEAFFIRVLQSPITRCIVGVPMIDIAINLQPAELGPAVTAAFC